MSCLLSERQKLTEGIMPTLSSPAPLARRRISSGEKSVVIVLLVCEGLIRGAFTPFLKAWL